MEEVALGFANTVDYEIEWDSIHLQNLIEKNELSITDIKEKSSINDIKELLASMLFHMREGSGCGMVTKRPEIIDEFIKGMKYQVSLGGTNMRAAEVISSLGGTGIVHLVSKNKETEEKMPLNFRGIGGDDFNCCFPHIALQFPKGDILRVGNVEFQIPRENRVIYSGDIACKQMPLDRKFLQEASRTKILLLSSFDLITELNLMKQRLSQVQETIEKWGKKRPIIFYEHACFADKSLEYMVLEKMGALVDIYSMNEDEFQNLIEKRINLLDEKEVFEGLEQVRKKVPYGNIIIHTSLWGCVFGESASALRKALEYGMYTATTRYRQGWVDKISIEETSQLQIEENAAIFSRKLERCSPEFIKCIPVVNISVEKPTTIGLGDSFVGGFLYSYSLEL